jgi:(1->4)-alpha-D-glucan 1-alpha-D-glucosylmutase
MGAPDIPRATYRMQLNRALGFRAAAALVPYLARLGVSHCYFSPYLKTRPGSEHGYDVVDHSMLNPEIGDQVDYEHLCESLAAEGMSQIVDIVPNHVGIMGKEGKWWLDVLEHGQASSYAEYFDIDWRPVTAKLKDKVLVPVLGDQYGNVLQAGELILRFDETVGELSVFYFDHRFPVDPSAYPTVLEPSLERIARRTPEERTSMIELESIMRSLRGLPPHTAQNGDEREVRAHETFIAKRRLAELCARSAAIAEHVRRNVALHNGTAGELASFERLHQLLERQPYRLAYWRVAADEINYRRFFDINDLAGLRTQNEEVLEATHRKVLGWAAERKISGFRIDHPDGLYDPRGYLGWLRQRVAELGRPDLYVVVEKILAAHEHLPRGWPVQGTTGYDFANAVNGVFVHAPSEKELDRVYRAFTQERDSFDALLYRCKQQILGFHLSSELTVLANLLNRLAEMRLETRDFTLNSIRGALLELVAAFPVYRSYVTPDHIGDQDRQHIEWAIAAARHSYSNRDNGIFDFVKRLLFVDVPDDADAAYRRHAAAFTAKFQQLTAPVMAKALEDTCFYRHVSLLSLNEVGGDPRRFGVTPAAFHRLNELRLQHWPHSMLATSTHDSKRSEDVRARLDVLSEIPLHWGVRLAKWRRINRSKRRRLEGRTVPSRHEEYLLYQTLVGTWPVVNRPVAMDDYRARIEAYLVKALREAKVNTSWATPNVRYEELVLAFVRDSLAENSRNPFVDDVDDLVGAIALPGFLNGLGQTLLKLTSPGVPDVYQGNELWEFSLVDPDNRRPVDYAHRAALLTALEKAAEDGARVPLLLQELLNNIGDGRAKLYTVWRTLGFRAEHPLLFERGSYEALAVQGSRAEHVVAFARRHEAGRAVVAVGRWFASLPRHARDGAAPERTAVFEWQDTTLSLPAGEYRNVLSGRSVDVADAGLRAEQLFADFPIALLYGAAAPNGAARA